MCGMVDESAGLLIRCLRLVSQGFFFAKGKGKSALAQYIREHGPPPSRRNQEKVKGKGH